MFANFSGHQVEQTRLRQAINLCVEIEGFEDVANRWRKGLDVGAQVLANVRLIAHQPLHVQRRRVVKKLLRLLQ